MNNVVAGVRLTEGGPATKVRTLVTTAPELLALSA